MNVPLIGPAFTAVIGAIGAPVTGGVGPATGGGLLPGPALSPPPPPPQLLRTSADTIAGPVLTKLEATL